MGHIPTYANPVYRVLIAHYTKLVKAGLLAPEDVPGPLAMSAEWAVTRHLAKKVRRVLVSEGIATSTPIRTLPIPPITEDVMARLWSRVSLPDENGCCLWDKAGPDGYGSISIKNVYYKVHRVVWTALVGPIPPGLVIDHVWERGCMSRLCVAIPHLEPVTQAENERRARVAARVTAELDDES